MLYGIGLTCSMLSPVCWCLMVHNAVKYCLQIRCHLWHLGYYSLSGGAPRICTLFDQQRDIVYILTCIHKYGNIRKRADRPCTECWPRTESQASRWPEWPNQSMSSWKLVSHRPAGTLTQELVEILQYNAENVTRYALFYARTRVTRRHIAKHEYTEVLPAVNYCYSINPLKPSVILWLHFKCSAQYRPKLPFLISDIWVLRRSSCLNCVFMSHHLPTGAIYVQQWKNAFSSVTAGPRTMDNEVSRTLAQHCGTHYHWQFATVRCHCLSSAHA